MKLYVTPGSPYARMARIVVIEKRLESRVEVVFAQTRTAGSPYYRINPSGRVPYLVRDDGVGMEESAVICAWFDQLDGKPAFGLPAGEGGWEARRLEALARSLMDGLSVWLRELYRPPNERSPGVVRHESDRASRMFDVWEREVEHPYMRAARSVSCRITPGERSFGGRYSSRSQTESPSIRLRACASSRRASHPASPGGSTNAGLPSRWSNQAQIKADSSIPTPSPRTR